MVVFDFDVPASDLMILTDKASLLSKRPAQFAERVVWCRLLIN